MSNSTMIMAVATSRLSKFWKNKEMTWEELAEKLKDPVRTNETEAEYKGLSKAEKGKIKDVGGFVGGYLKNGRRVKGAVKHRQLITLDADSPSNDFLSDVNLMLDGQAYVVYSTHSHTKKAPRYRLIVPLARKVDPDEYQAISRKLADNIGLNHFDDTTYAPERLMFWPSVPSDGEYVYIHEEGRLTDPDKILAEYEDWRDPTLWPRSEKAVLSFENNFRKQEDPLKKENIIGDFCRAYTISSAIEKFLPDVYSPCDVEGRYTYVKGSTSAGAVVYEDKFIYSHHGTDPCSEKLCNAYDMVRIHLFGELDENAEKTPSNKRPSVSAMADFIKEDGEAFALRDRINKKAALDDFDDELLKSAQTEDAEAFEKALSEKLKRNRNGVIESTAQNVIYILKLDPLLKDKIGLDEFARRYTVKSSLPWRMVGYKKEWGDGDDASLRNYLSKAYEIVGKGVISDALDEVMYDKRFNPVKEYLDSVEWDGECRLENLFIDYLGAEDNDYVKAVTRKFFTAAVKRVYKPGCKFDNCLILTGRQGIGKSTIFKMLGMEWHNDSVVSIQGKDALEQIQGSWIIELGELQATRKADNDLIKAFISRSEDRFRVAYGKRTEYYPRQCVFCGTTNDRNFLKDRTGNRRFWPVGVGLEEATKNLWRDLTKEEIGQVWAEAKFYFSNGEELYLTGELEQTSIEMQEFYTEGSEQLGLIEEFLDIPIPTNWYDLTLESRKFYIRGYLGGTLIEADKKEETVRRDKICVLEIWCELFDQPRERLDNAKARELGNVIQHLKGWEAARGSISKTGRLRFGTAYGAQKAFVRTVDFE